MVMYEPGRIHQVIERQLERRKFRTEAERMLFETMAESFGLNIGEDDFRSEYLLRALEKDEIGLRKIEVKTTRNIQIPFYVISDRNGENKLYEYTSRRVYTLLNSYEGPFYNFQFYPDSYLLNSDKNYKDNFYAVNLRINSVSPKILQFARDCHNEFKQSRRDMDLIRHSRKLTDHLIEASLGLANLAIRKNLI